MDLGKDFYLEYVEAMNREYKFGASEETMHLIAQLAHHFGEASYRPISRLLLQNWDILIKRVADYTEEEWEQAKEIAAMSKEGLEPLAVAMFLEVMEGEDTSEQLPFKEMMSTEELEKYAKLRELEDQRLAAANKAVQ